MAKKFGIIGIIALAVVALTLFVLPLKKVTLNYGCHTVTKHAPLVKISTSEEAGVSDDDITWAQPVHLYIIYGEAAKRIAGKKQVNLIIDQENSRLAVLEPDKVSPTGKDVVDKGIVVLYIVTGHSARILHEKWGGMNFSYDEEQHIAVYLDLPKEISI